jgi:hypothetical protein
MMMIYSLEHLMMISWYCLSQTFDQALSKEDLLFEAKHTPFRSHLLHKTYFALKALDKALDA